MQLFSTRHTLRSEYSGYGDASLSLRNRLLQLYGMPYSGDEYQFGINNENWIHERAFNKDLQMHFGSKTPIEDFRYSVKTSYDQVFDFIELYYKRALEDLDIVKRKKLHAAICTAFANSGSVYGFSEEGQVILKVDSTTAEQIADADIALDSISSAQEMYRSCVNGLISRSKLPRDIVGNMHVVLEDFLKAITKQQSYDKAVSALRDKFGLHSTQIQILEKLRGYRGDVWGSAHAGNSPEPQEEDAVWYLDTVIAQIKYVAAKIKNQDNTEDNST